MPGKRPIDIGQHSSDRTIQKGSLSGTVPPHIALRSDTLNKFGKTSSFQLTEVITDETGIGNLVFNTNATLITPSFNNISTVVTGELLTGTTTANQILLSFPKFTGSNNVYGCAEILVQSEVGNTINTILPDAVVHRKITKFLLLFEHSTGAVFHNEYAGLSTSSSSLGTWDFIDSGTTFNFVITPANNTTTLHKAIAFCFTSIDNVWKPPF